MKKLSVVLYITAALVLLLGGPSGTSGALAGPLPNKPASTNTAVAAAAGTAVLTIPAAAFTPFEDGYDFENHGRYLQHFNNPTAISGVVGWYLAPVHLPHGATVTKMTFYYRDNTTDDGSATLRRTISNGGYEDMASIDTSGGWSPPWYNSKSTTTINHAVIDNSYYNYWVLWELPRSFKPPNEQKIVWGCGVVIEYTPPATVVGRLSIPAAAFTPFEDGYDYENHGRYLFVKVGASGAYGWFSAHVRLPHGATVTKMTFHWYDDDTNNLRPQGIARLQRTKFGQGNFEEMAYAETLASGYGSTSDNTIAYASIDNSQYGYWVSWDLPISGSGISVRGCGVVIEYTVPATGDGPLSISSAPFKPYEDGYDFQNDSRYLQHLHSPGGGSANGWYLAQVHLPQGVTVTKMTFHWHNTSSNNGVARLQRTRLGQGNFEEMATATTESVLPLAFGSSYDDTILYATIDNSQYTYWVVWDLPVPEAIPTNNVWGCGVVIEYGYRAYLPVVLKNH